MQTKKMRTEKCWFEKGDFDHFRMCFGCFRAHFGPGGSLKQPGTSKKSKMMLTKQMRTGKCWFKKVILTIFGCVLGVLGLFWTRGVPKTAPARQKS